MSESTPIEDNADLGDAAPPDLKALKVKDIILDSKPRGNA